jgi:hypothetical protein
MWSEHIWIGIYICTWGKYLPELQEHYSYILLSLQHIKKMIKRTHEYYLHTTVKVIKSLHIQ